MVDEVSFKPSLVVSFKHDPRVSSSARLRLPPSPTGKAVEGDVNATVISATSLTGNIFAALELRDFAIKLYTKDDLKIFLDAIEK